MRALRKVTLVDQPASLRTQLPPQGLLPEHDPEIIRIIRLAKTHLDMDVAFVSQFVGGKQVYQAAAGDTASFGIELHDGPALAGTYCHRLVANVIRPVIADTSSDPHVAQLKVTTDKRIGAYVGVPLRLSAGELYGTFCCLSHDPDPALSERDGRFMAMLADIIADRLKHTEGLRREREHLVDVIDRRRFDTALQPIVSAITGELVGTEALTRFAADLGSPDVVFARAHDLGIGVDLEVAAFLQSRDLLHLLPAGVYLAMNLSPAALMDPRMLELLAAVDDPGRCVLELTEHVSVDGYTQLAAAVEPLRKRGFRIAVDDVGAGYASFHHVLELAPDIIKIDRSLVAGAAHDGARRRIITSVVLLGLDMAATVVAEGVEGPDDLNAMADLGVDAVQGYLLGRPTTDHRDAARWRRRWQLDALTTPQAELRDSFGRALRDLRGTRLQVDVLRAVNEQLASTGESARVSQGQYSAYENGHQRPQPVRLRAIEAVLDLEAGTLDALLGRSTPVPPSATCSPTTPRARSSAAAKVGQSRRGCPPAT